MPLSEIADQAGKGRTSECGRRRIDAPADAENAVRADTATA